MWYVVVRRKMPSEILKALVLINKTVSEVFKNRENRPCGLIVKGLLIFRELSQNSGHLPRFFF